MAPTTRNLNWVEPQGRPYRIIAAIWLLAMVVYLFGAVRQSSHLNLSATAGGQYPYLVYAQGMAEQGWFSYVGDRNRMPLYPAMLSLMHDPDWSTFVFRAQAFAIVNSIFFLAITATILYRLLPPWPATAVGLIAAFVVYLPKASFVQAELAYYSLFLMSCTLIAYLLVRPNWAVALLAGAVIGVAYSTKASALVLMGVTIGCLLMRPLIRVPRMPPETFAANDSLDGTRRFAGSLFSILLFICGFLMVASPLIYTNITRYGRPLYNVNSTYFMWCDSWEQARQFETRFDLVGSGVDARSDVVPGPVNYWRTHALSDIARRFTYGLGTLAILVWKGAYFKYLAIAAALWMLCSIRNSRIRSRVYERVAILSLFAGLSVAAYLLVYAWYTPVAYGDRFLLSLLIPVMVYLWWRAVRCAPSRDDQKSWVNVVAMLIIPLLFIEGVYAATVRCVRPTPEFVTFYYNETVERLREGNLNEAARGFRGVVRLDPARPAPHKHLGMIALAQGNPAEAIGRLKESVRLDAQDADAWNSLGGAYMATDRAAEAIDAFEHATRINPTLPIAWYNLGGARAQIGDVAGARRARDRLHELDAGLARQLEQLIEE